MSFVDCELTGGFANRMSKYAFARAYARRVGATLRTTPWKGQEIFALDDPPMVKGELPDRESYYWAKWDGETNVNIQGVSQHGMHLIYSRADARSWFALRPEIKALLEPVPRFEVAAHLRHGDFQQANGFIAIKRESYLRAAEEYGIDPAKIRFISEEEPIVVPGIDPNYKWRNRTTDDLPGLGFLPDFHALCIADVLFRGPSTFSWWAGVLGEHSRIFSPWQEGIEWRGTDRGLQDVPFVEGNHAPISFWWEGHSELNLKET